MKLLVRITLKKGETVITDGKITARGRCANRVEELPQQATSMSEPPAIKFDQPMQPFPGTATTTPPVPFESSLLTPPQGPGSGPAPPLSLYNPLGGGYGWVPISPPPAFRVRRRTEKTCPRQRRGHDDRQRPRQEEENRPVREWKRLFRGGSGAWNLVASGIALIYWAKRHKIVYTPIV